MKSALHGIGLNSTSIDYPDTPASITNIRFRQEDVTYFEPKLLVVGKHKINSTHRYHPLDWNDDFPSATNEDSGYEPSSETDPRRSEELRTRAAMQGVEYSPHHIKIQNALYECLKKIYGKQTVRYEKNYVDISVFNENEIIYFEIKTALTAKRCVREALGQLLEYGHYADKNNATKLIVVGDANYQPDDIVYLSNLRKYYNLPIFYQQWCWDRNELSDAI